VPSKAPVISDLAGLLAAPHFKKDWRRPQPSGLVESESMTFAARMRGARAVLGWSQTELGKKAGVTQRAVYRLEKAAVKARHLTQVRINKAFEDAGIAFAELPNGGFEMIVRCQLVNVSRQKSAVRS
jgi:DNA-binding XRE family transcriptional regulator